MPYELQKSQSYGGKRMCFHDDEVAEMKHFGEAGWCLIEMSSNFQIVCFSVIVSMFHWR